jgi:hypothetical protein
VIRVPCFCGAGVSSWPFATSSPETVVGRFRGKADMANFMSTRPKEQDSSRFSSLGIVDSSCYYSKIDQLMGAGNEPRALPYFNRKYFFAEGLPLAAGENDPGVNDAEITLGNTMPYSGPASAWGTVGKSEAAYFCMINDQGGINGRKIKLCRRRNCVLRFRVTAFRVRLSARADNTRPAKSRRS